MRTIETLTPEEAAIRLREAGMKITPVIIRDGMKQGVFPFGDVIETEKTNRFLIYRKFLERWIAERCE